VSVFFVTSEEFADALVSASEYMSKVRVFVWPGGLVPADPSLWLMEWTTAYELRKLTVVYKRTPATGVAQDAAMTTHHFLNLTGGLPDASWTSTDYTAVETAFDTFWTTAKTMYTSATSLAEYVWRADGPAFRPFGSELSPTLRRTARAVAGTGTGEALPPQVAVSVTETTAAKYTVEDVEGSGAQLRNRWGRFYLPAMTVSKVTNGRLAAATQVGLADAVETLYEACVTAQLIPVMYSPTTGHAWSVLEVHVDDIFDVIRSRRFVTPLSREPRVITQPT
jgi:hypothetical protein